jgi:transposase, IS5 family
MVGQSGFFDVEDRLKQLSAKGDALERLSAVVDFEPFRADLEHAVVRSDRSRGGRPPFDHVLMFESADPAVAPQSVGRAHRVPRPAPGQALIRDRLSFMRFLRLGLADTVPDANTIWGFREALTRARIADRPAIEVLFERFDAVLAMAGFLAMGGQIIDASIVAAPKQRNTNGEKRDIKEGCIPPAWADKPAKLRQKDRDARWTVKYTKAKPNEEGGPRVDLAVPAFGYKNHLGIDRRHRLIRRWRVTDAARHDGALLPGLIDPNNTASDVWADTAYRSQANEKFLAGRPLRSQIHRKKPKGKPMPRPTARKSAVRAAVEHVFARHKGPMGLFIRTIGIARARTKIGLANLVYNMMSPGSYTRARGCWRTLMGDTRWPTTLASQH